MMWKMIVAFLMLCGLSFAEECNPYMPGACDDGYLCTVDICVTEPSVHCEHIPDDYWCDDGLYCNGDEVCEPEPYGVPTGCKQGAETDPCAEGTYCQEALDCCSDCVGDFDCDGYHDDTDVDYQIAYGCWDMYAVCAEDANGYCRIPAAPIWDVINEEWWDGGHQKCCTFNTSIVNDSCFAGQCECVSTGIYWADWDVLWCAWHMTTSEAETAGLCDVWTDYTNPPCAEKSPATVCFEDDNCSEPTPYCVNNECVECKNHSDCRPPITDCCVANECVACTS